MDTIFIVEDHPQIRRSYAALIKRAPHLIVCGEAGSAEEALVALLQVTPNLVLIDVSLPGMSGVELVSYLRHHQPHLATLVVSGHDEVAFIQGVLDAGAGGYVMKDHVPHCLIVAIEQVLAGRQYVSEPLPLCYNG